MDIEWMEFKNEFMLLDYTYLLTDFDPFFFSDENAEKGEFIFPVDERFTDNIAEVFQTLSRSKSQFALHIPFNLARHGHNFFKEETFRDIIRLFFLPNYLRVDHKIVFFTGVADGEEKHPGEFENKFYVDLRQQGINDFIVEALMLERPWQNGSNVNSISFYDAKLNGVLKGSGGEGFQVFVESDAFAENFNIKWIVPIADRDDFRRKTKRIEEFEKWMWQATPRSSKVIL